MEALISMGEKEGDLNGKAPPKEMKKAKGNAMMLLANIGSEDGGLLLDEQLKVF